MKKLRRLLAARDALFSLNLESADAATLAALLPANSAALRLKRLSLNTCDLSPEVLPALSSLIRGGALEDLSLHFMARYRQPVPLLGVEGIPPDEPASSDDEDIAWNDPRALVYAPAASAEVMADLAASLTAPACALTQLWLIEMDLWRAPVAASMLLRALIGHPTLKELCLHNNAVRDDAQRTAASTALGALVAANSPALTKLETNSCDLGNAGLAPMLAALPHNTHLRVLDISHNRATSAFLNGTVLPALRTNASLREARVLDYGGPPEPLLTAMMEEIEAREGGRRAAARSN